MQRLLSAARKGRPPCLPFFREPWVRLLERNGRKRQNKTGRGVPEGEPAAGDDSVAFAHSDRLRHFKSFAVDACQQGIRFVVPEKSL